MTWSSRTTTHHRHRRDGDPERQHIFHYHLQPVYFDAEVEFENPVSGFVSKEIAEKKRKLVPSKGILGFVQLAPRGLPLSPATFDALLARQGGSIGGPMDCVVDIGRSGQKMRLNRFDVAEYFTANGATPVFAGAGRGSVVLPRTAGGAWCNASAANGHVSPLPQDLQPAADSHRPGDQTVRCDEPDRPRINNCCGWPTRSNCSAPRPQIPSTTVSCTSPTPRKRSS